MTAITHTHEGLEGLEANLQTTRSAEARAEELLSTAKRLQRQFPDLVYENGAFYAESIKLVADRIEVERDPYMTISMDVFKEIEGTKIYYPKSVEIGSVDRGQFDVYLGTDRKQGIEATLMKQGFSKAIIDAVARHRFDSDRR